MRAIRRDGDFLRTAARTLSTVCNPFLTAAALFFALVRAQRLDAGATAALTLETLFFSAVGPMLYVVWCKRSGRISDLDMSVRSEREALFGGFVAFYAAGALGLRLMHAPPLILATMAGYTLNVALVGAITRVWKISTHAVGVAAPAVVAYTQFGPRALPLLALVPLVGWARLRLRAHTPAQVVAGALLGGASVFVFLRLFGLT